MNYIVIRNTGSTLDSALDGLAREVTRILNQPNIGFPATRWELAGGISVAFTTVTLATAVTPAQAHFIVAQALIS